MRNTRKRQNHAGKLFVEYYTQQLSCRQTLVCRVSELRNVAKPYVEYFQTVPGKRKWPTAVWGKHRSNTLLSVCGVYSAKRGPQQDATCVPVFSKFSSLGFTSGAKLHCHVAHLLPSASHTYSTFSLATFPTLPSISKSTRQRLFPGFKMGTSI